MVTVGEDAGDDLSRRLRHARAALDGTDLDGQALHPSMFDPQVLSLAHGDGTRRPHSSVIAAGVHALLDSAGGSLENYLFLQRDVELEAAVGEDFRSGGIPSRYAESVCIDSGTTRLFGSFLGTCAQPGDVFLVPTGYYHPLPSWCEIAGVDLRLVRTDRANAYRLTPQDLHEWLETNRDVATRVRGLFLFNPTQAGVVYSAEQLHELALELESNDMLVLEDSVFAGTEFPGTAPIRHLAGVAPELGERIVTLRGASKAHNLANIRIGWAGGPPAIIDGMRRFGTSTIATVPRIAKSMALAALISPPSYRQANAVECADRVQLVDQLVAHCNDELADGFETPPLGVAIRPGAGHGVVLDADGLGRRLGLPSRCSIEISRWTLGTAQVAVSPGLSLGFDGGEVRLAVGSVGLHHTYASAAPSELRATCRRLATLAGPHQADKLLAVAEEMGGAGDSGIDDIPDAGFAAGRAMITAAFVDRLLPVMRELGQTTSRRCTS